MSPRGLERKDKSVVEFYIGRCFSVLVLQILYRMMYHEDVALAKLAKGIQQDMRDLHCYRKRYMWKMGQCSVKRKIKLTTIATRVKTLVKNLNKSKHTPNRAIHNIV